MSKRTREDAGEERVTAKSKPMMNLVSRCSVRDPNVLASTLSESPVKTKSESQIPLKSWNEHQRRTGRPVLGASSSKDSEWNIDEKWSFQEWKSGELLEARTVRPVVERKRRRRSCWNRETCLWTTTLFLHPAHRQVCHWWRWYGLWHRNRIGHFVKITIILAESQWPIAVDTGPVFKRCKERRRQTFFHLVNVHVFNIGSICVHGKELLRKFTLSKIQGTISRWNRCLTHLKKVDSRTIRWDFWSEYN